MAFTNFVSRCIHGESPMLYGDGNQARDFMYIDDCVAGIRRAITNFHKAQTTTFNIAFVTNMSLVALAEAFVSELGANSTIYVESSRTGEIRRYVADIAKAEKVLGYRPEVDFATGMMRTINWYTSDESHLKVIRGKA